MSVLERLQGILSNTPKTAIPKLDDQSDLNLACAALLVEVARADYVDDPREMEAVIKVIREVLKMPETDISELIAEANSEVTEATSMFPHTSLINQHCSRDQKYVILKAMWRVAFADNNLDKYEEHLIRRVADLIHLDHSEFIQAKIEARDGCNPDLS